MCSNVDNHFRTTKRTQNNIGPTRRARFYDKQLNFPTKQQTNYTRVVAALLVKLNIYVKLL